jgi:hypothetical protein
VQVLQRERDLGHVEAGLRLKRRHMYTKATPSKTLPTRMEN